MAINEYLNAAGDVVGLKAYVNTPPKDGGLSWNKHAKVFRFDVFGGRRAARVAAQDWESAQKRLVRAGDYVDAATQRVTIETYWRANVELILAGLRPNVRRNYLSAYRNVIGPTLGKVSLVDFKGSHLDMLKSAMRLKRMAPSTQNGTINALSRTLEYAVRDRRIARNFARDPGVRFRVTKPMPGDRVTVTPEEVEVIATALDGLHLGLGNAVRVDFYTGLRAQELWALKVGDIDLAGQRITVQRAWIGTDETGRKLGPPKSGQGRMVPVLGPISDLLKELTDGLDPDEWLLVGQQGKAIWHSNYLSSIGWKSFVEDLGYPGLRFHDLRHSYVSWLVEQGVVASVVQAIVGHADLRVTQRYIHIPDRLLDDAIRIIAGKTTEAI